MEAALRTLVYAQQQAVASVLWNGTLKALLPSRRGGGLRDLDTSNLKISDAY